MSQMTAHELSHFFHDDMNWCACGMPSEAAKLVLSLLRLAPFYNSQEALEKLLPSHGLFYFTMYALDQAGLLEHGGGIGGSWLTDKGLVVLRSLENLSKTDPELDTIFDQKNIPQDCKKCFPEPRSPRND